MKRWLSHITVVVAAAAVAPPTVLLISGGSGDALQTFAFDAGTGAATWLSSSPVSPGGAGWLAFPPSGTGGALPRVAFGIGAGAGGNGSVTSYAVDGAGGVAAFGDVVSSGGAGPAHALVHQSSVLVANYGSGHVAVLPVGSGWRLGSPAQVLLAGANAHQVLASPDGAFIFVPCLGADWVAQYAWDPARGRLVPATPPVAPVTPGAGPRHMAFHPSAATAFVLNELDSTLAVFAYDAARGVLGPGPAYASTLPASVPAAGQSAAAVVVAPDGRFVYTTNRGVPYCGIAVFPFAVGALGPPAFVAENAAALYWPRFAALSPDRGARFLLVVGERAGAFVVFARDAAGGGLTRVATVNTSGLRGPSWGGIFATAATASGAGRRAPGDGGGAWAAAAAVGAAAAALLRRRAP